MTESKTKAAAEDTAQDLAKLREDIASLRSDLMRLVRSLGGDAGDIAGNVSQEARQLYDRLAKEGERSAAALAREFEQRPLTTLLIAFAVGFIGGRLLPR